MLRTAVEEMRSALGASRSRIKLFDQPVHSEPDDKETNPDENNLEGSQSGPEKNATDNQ
jgi:hypothetical protein